MNRIALFLGVFLIIIILAVVFIFNGDDSKPNNNQSAVKVLPLEEYTYDSSSQVSYTTRGKINGQDIHRSIEITVSGSERRIDIFQGYDGTIINTQMYPNSEQAYEQFLHAIKDAGFMNKKKNSTVTNPDGKCPTGQLYFYKLRANAEELSNLWAGSCSTNIGISLASRSLVQTLFRAQITDYSKITSGVDL